jgi:hypothetical protein
MCILPIVPLPKHQIIIFTHEAIRKKVRGQLGEMEKVTPTDPMPMGARQKEKINERAPCSTHGFIHANQVPEWNGQPGGVYSDLRKIRASIRLEVEC